MGSYQEYTGHISVFQGSYEINQIKRKFLNLTCIKTGFNTLKLLKYASEFFLAWLFSKCNRN